MRSSQAEFTQETTEGFFQIETMRQYWKMNEKESPLKCLLIHDSVLLSIHTV